MTEPIDTGAYKCDLCKRFFPRKDIKIYAIHYLSSSSSSWGIRTEPMWEEIFYAACPKCEGEAGLSCLTTS
jgi:hypothetical protein